MGTPFVYVGTWTIKEGKLGEARKWLAEHCDFVETNEPRMIAFHMYFDEDGRSCSVVQVHPDSTSMEFHMQLLSEHMGAALDYIDQIVTEQYFGPMSDDLAKTLAQWEEPGVTVIKRPDHVGGFTRAAVR
jgi:hypothetical protein